MKKKKTKKPTLKELFACRSVKAIITLMKKYGIKGEPADNCDCPMARFARKAGVPHPSVHSNGSCRVIDPNDEVADVKEVFGPSRIRRAFIFRFDGGKLSELVA